LLEKDVGSLGKSASVLYVEPRQEGYPF